MEKYPPKEETKEDLNSRSNLHLPETKFSKLKNSDDVEKANHVESILKSNFPNHGNSDTDFVGLFTSSRYDPGISFSGMSLSDPVVSTNIASLIWGFFKARGKRGHEQFMLLFQNGCAVDSTFAFIYHVFENLPCTTNCEGPRKKIPRRFSQDTCGLAGRINYIL
jgi:hypothetical protein